MFALVLHIQLSMLKQFIFGAVSMNKKAAQHSRQMCAETEPCFQIRGFCRIMCLSISTTPVSESSEIAVIYLFFSLWHFLNSEVVPLALSNAAVMPSLFFLATTQVSTAETGQCQVGSLAWAGVFGDTWTLCCLCHLGCAPKLGPGVGLQEATSVYGGQRGFLWH